MVNKHQISVCNLCQGSLSSQSSITVPISDHLMKLISHIAVLTILYNFYTSYTQILLHMIYYYKNSDTKRNTAMSSICLYVK